MTLDEIDLWHQAIADAMDTWETEEEYNFYHEWDLDLSFRGRR